MRAGEVVALLACVVVLLSYVDEAQAQLSWLFSKENFDKLHCNGTYNTKDFAILDRKCDDCYNVFREPTVYVQCRHDCYSTEFFPACLQTLQYDEEQPEYQQIVQRFAGKGFDILPPINKSQD